MKPRIYTYKVTFEEVPFWYWGVHKEKNFGEVYLGSPVTHKWVWEFWTPKVQILEIFDNWAEAIAVEKRLILPDLNNPLCLNACAAGFVSLEVLRKAASLGGKAGNARKDERGRSLAGVLGAAAAHKQKDENGKSLTAKKAGQKTVEKGVGIHNPEVRSRAGKTGGKVTSSQVWESTVDGFRSSACVVARHNKLRGWSPEARVRIY